MSKYRSMNVWLFVTLLGMAAPSQSSLLSGLKDQLSAGLKDENGLKNPIEDEIRKLAEEAITAVIDTALPNTVDILESHNLSKSFKGPLGVTLVLRLAFNGECGLNSFMCLTQLSGTQMTNLDSANTTFGNFTDTGVNVTILFGRSVLVSNASGTLCEGSTCREETDQLVMTVPLTIEAAVTYKIKKVFGVPVGLDGVPCLGPVLESSLGTASVTGWGPFDEYVTEAVNAAIKDQGLFEKPMDQAVNVALSKAEPKCNLTAN